MKRWNHEFGKLEPGKTEYIPINQNVLILKYFSFDFP